MDDVTHDRPTCGTLGGVQTTPSPPPRAALRRPALRPGVHVLRRSRDELQVGLDPHHALVLPSGDPYRTTLDALASPAASGAAAQRYDAVTLSLLDDAGLLVDYDTLLPLVPSGPGATAPCPRTDVAAVATATGDAVAETLARRAAHPVEVRSCGDPAAGEVARLVTDLLTGGGCRATAQNAASPRTVGPTPAEPIAAVLVVVGEPARELVDDWVRDGTPHVLLRLTEGRVLLGPFVVPGATACLRCLDAHHTDVDPAWPLLVAQYAAATERGRADALPEPVDSLLATLAAAWAARDMVTYLEGRSPSTASTTLLLDARLGSLEAQTWARHPACGCSWTEKPAHTWTRS